jgi:6-pyruvoyl-tetrahydropterin synthase
MFRAFLAHHQESLNRINSRVALDSLKNIHNHSFLIEEIRLILSKLERTNWTMVFSWVKAHVGIMGNELADQTAKAAVRENENTTTYNRMPKSTLYKEIEDETIIKWQKAWEGSPKAAMKKQFFPNISDRLKTKITVTPNFTAPVTGHSKTRAYLHRFKLLESATCLCGKEEQTTDRLMYRCILLQQPRETLKRET